MHAAGEGDQEAWNAIVERFGGLVWATVRAHRLNAADGAEVVQTTWLRLVEHLDRIRDPERLGGWLAATARNECLRQIRLGAREVPSEMAAFESGDDGTLDQSLLTAERDRAFWKAFTALGERCQALLRVLMAETGAELPGGLRGPRDADRRDRADAPALPRAPRAGPSAGGLRRGAMSVHEPESCSSASCGGSPRSSTRSRRRSCTPGARA